MNDQNLIPNSERTPREIKQNTTKGGIKSGESRRKKADMRKMAQNIILGTYKTKQGKEMTGEEILVSTIVTAMSDPKNKNWGKAVDLLVSLTTGNKSAEEIEKIKAETELIKAKAKLLSGADETGLLKLDAILSGLREYAQADEETE